MSLAPTICFHPEAYTTRGPKLMGRHAAGESFLRGLLTHGRHTRCPALIESPEHGRLFQETVAGFGRDPASVELITASRPEGLRRSGLLFVPGPVIGEYAWRRARSGDAAWSLCGVTHTLSSHLAMDAVANLLSAPVQPWDALICTSTAGRAAVVELLQQQAAYLRRRFNPRRFVMPQLPVIPLGIHTRDFVFTDARRASARQALGADPNTVVVLFAGRLSFHAKAHPLAMYQALERAARTLAPGQRLLLVEFGQHGNEPIARAFAEAAALACPSVPVRHLDGKVLENRDIAWSAADIFCSLSDNIQETFGITPLEAMASGLPVVVSDWDGYKDTVRHGIDGFRVPTVAPPPGSGVDLADRHALDEDNYDLYCGRACAVVAVDIDVAAAAFARLIASPELRRKMGDAGRARAGEVFDWAALIPRYEALWGQLDELRRRAAAAPERTAAPWPARLDPFRHFANYSTLRLAPETSLALAGQDAEAAVAWAGACRKLGMFGYAAPVLPSPEEVAAILARAADGPCAAAGLVADVPPERRDFAFRGLLWLLKIGVLRWARK